MSLLTFTEYADKKNKEAPVINGKKRLIWGSLFDTVIALIGYTDRFVRFYNSHEVKNNSWNSTDFSTGTKEIV